MPQLASDSIAIDFLADHPARIDLLAAHFHNEWKPFYDQRGWTVLETTHHCGHRITVMRRDIGD